MTNQTAAAAAVEDAPAPAPEVVQDAPALEGAPQDEVKAVPVKVAATKTGGGSFTDHPCRYRTTGCADELVQRIADRPFASGTIGKRDEAAMICPIRLPTSAE